MPDVTYPEWKASDTPPPGTMYTGGRYTSPPRTPPPPVVVQVPTYYPPPAKVRVVARPRVIVKDSHLGWHMVAVVATGGLWMVLFPAYLAAKWLILAVPKLIAAIIRATR